MRYLAILWLILCLTACVSIEPEAGFGGEETRLGIHIIEIQPDDLRQRPIRIAPNGDFEFPGFSRGARRWWENFYYMRYEIDPALPKFCSGRFRGEAATEVSDFFQSLEQSPPRLPALDKVSIIAHAINYDVKIGYFGGSARYGPVYPALADAGELDLQNDWQRLASRVLDIFDRSGMTVKNWNPDPARVTDLRCR